MKRLNDLVIFRLAPLGVGALAKYYWGNDTGSREAIVFLLATLVTHSLLSVFNIAKELDKLSDKVIEM